MCVCVAPGKLSDTIVLASEVQVNGEVRHVMGYQNRPRTRRGPNAMILPVPALPQTLAPEALVLTEDFPHILEDMREAIFPVPAADPVTAIPMQAVPDVVVFEHGIYTVVLAQHAHAIPDAYPLVPQDKRPPLKMAIFDAYAEWYPEWPVLVCCFDNRQAAKASPILLSYRPRFPQTLFAPGLDSHTGRVPNRKARVSVDHTIVLAAEDMQNGLEVRYRDDIPAGVRPLLPQRVIGFRSWARLPNGDWCVPLDTVRAGWTSTERYAPPYLGLAA